MKFKLINSPIIKGITIIFSFEMLYSQQFTEVAEELGVQDSAKFSGNDVHWVDFNGDNLLDLYVVNPGAFILPYRPHSNRLYMNQIPTTGKFIDVASLVNADVETGASSTTAWVDFDSDGWIDLYVENGPGFFGAPDVPNMLLKNNEGVFTDIAPSLGIDFLWTNYGARAVGDPDGDGDQDIYIITPHSGKNILLRNDGDKFIDVAEAWGIAGHESELNPGTIGASWIDFNNDGRLDLFVSNSATMPNRLFRNDLEISGRFIDVAVEVGIDLTDFYKLPISHAWGDYDNDGDFDLFIAHITNDTTRSMLFRNDVNVTGVFNEVGAEVGVGDPGRSEGSNWADYDNDGDLDLYITYSVQPNRLYRNDINTTGLFVEVADDEGVNSDADDLACAWGDYDNDGDLDLYVANSRSPIRSSLNLLYRNEQNDLNYLKVRPLSANGSYSRHGSRVYVYKAGTDSLVAVRRISGDLGGFISQSQYDAHFGLDGTKAYDIVVRFTTRVNGENIVIDKNIKPELGGLVPVDIGGFIEVRDTVNVIVSVEDEPEAVLPKSPMLYQNYPNPFNAETLISFYLPKGGDVKIIIYNILGERVSLVHEGYLPAGEHQISWDASESASGIYIYRLKSDAFNISRKMLLLK